MPGLVKNLMGSGFSGGQAIALNGYSTVGATATGSTQGTAYVLQNEFTEFTTVAASTGAILPASSVTTGIVAGDSFFVANLGANALSVYPPVGGNINGGTVNAAASVPAAKTAYFVAKGNGTYYSVISA